MNQPSSLNHQPSTLKAFERQRERIIGKFGGADELRMVNQLQELLYAP